MNIITRDHLEHSQATPPLRISQNLPAPMRPEAAFDGRILIIDLPVQEFRLAGRVANLAWKYCFQVTVLRKQLPSQDISYQLIHQAD